MRSVLRSALAGCLFMATTGCAREAPMLELGPDDSVATMTSSGEVLAVGLGHRDRYDVRVSREIPEDQAYVLLLRDGSEVARTPPEPGALRGLISTRSGFVVLRVVYSSTTGAVEAHVSTLSLDGTQRSLPTLATDVLGVFCDAEDNVYAYSSRQVLVHPRSGGGWREVDALPGWKKPISKIVALDDGPIAVAGGRSMAGVRRVGDAHPFLEDFGDSVRPLELHGAGGSWWVVLPGEGEQKVMQVDRQGVVHASVTMRDVLVQGLHSWKGKVILVCSGKGRAVHKAFFYEWNAEGDGALRGPVDLPDDITKSTIWRGSLVSGGPGRKIFWKALK